jgi:hypothetical protein
MTRFLYVKKVLLPTALLVALIVPAHSTEPTCGSTVNEALAAARSASEVDRKEACLISAIELLATKLERLRTGKDEFGIIRAAGYSQLDDQ